jgi:hypothetical protein
MEVESGPNKILLNTIGGFHTLQMKKGTKCISTQSENQNLPGLFRLKTTPRVVNSRAGASAQLYFKI